MASPLLKAAQAAMKGAGAVGATKTATLRRTVTTFTPSTGNTTTSTTDYSWTGVLTDYADSVIDGTSIIAGDRKFLGAASDITVTPDPETDTLLIASTTYSIVRVKTDPADATYELQVRR